MPESSGETAGLRETELAEVALAVWDWLRAANYRGHDPYDGLKSRLLAPLLGRSRVARLAVIQGVKHAPFDLRPWLRVPAARNPKGLALVLQGLAAWEAPAGRDEAGVELADHLVGLASTPEGAPALGTRDYRPGIAARLAGDPGLLPVAGWGYDFPWQSRAFLQPAYTPTVVATSFVVDAFAASTHPAAPAVTEAAARFVEETLHRHEDASGLCFSYSPHDRTRVYNASLFGAKILARAAQAGGERAPAREEAAARAADFVGHRQAADGAWVYGEADHWQWIDNLHTGFVLETLADLQRLLGRDTWQGVLDRGWDQYRRDLFAEPDLPRYFTTSTLPLDAHTFAQAALTCLALADRRPELRDDAAAILQRAIRELWDPRRRGFRAQKGRFPTQSTIYLRWSQAWMFRALATWLGGEEAAS